ELAVLQAGEGGDQKDQPERDPLERLLEETHGGHSGDDARPVEAVCRCGHAMREQRLDELRYSEVAVVLVQVTFDQPGRDVQAARVDRARIGPLGVRHVADSRDPVALDGHVGEVELSGGDVDDGPAFDDEMCGRLAYRDVYPLPAPGHP